MRILLLSLIFWTSLQVHGQAIVAYTERNYQGQAFFFDSIGNFKIPPYIKIQSVRFQNDCQLQVSFDFSSGCNSLDYGAITFITTDATDIYERYGCDRDFSRIREVYVRPNMSVYKDTLKAFLYEEPYYMGKMVIVQPGTCPDITNLGLNKIGSVQLPRNSSILFFHDLKFRPSRKDNTYGKAVFYYCKDKGGLSSSSGPTTPEMEARELKEGYFKFDLPYIIDRWKGGLLPLQIKSIRFYKWFYSDLHSEADPNMPCNMLPEH